MERNVTLDYFKVILSILVISIHIGLLFISFPVMSWLIPQGIARIAVPCFFIINGYYLTRKIDDFKAVKKYILHLLLIYIVWSVFYIAIYSKTFDLLIILKDFIFGFFHLWYVVSLIGGCLLFFLTKKIIKNETALLILSITFFIVGFLLEEPIKSREDIYIVRNTFMAFPFIFIGYYIKSKNLAVKIKDTYLIPLIILSLITLCIESLYARTIVFIHDFYLSLIVLCPAIFTFIIKHSTYRKNNTYLTYLGSLASAIYFVHLFAILPLSNINLPYMYIRFLIVLFLSIILSIFIIYINKYIKIFL